MTTRTVRNWMRRDLHGAGADRRVGRPPHSARARAAAFWIVVRMWIALGKGTVGWRKVLQALAVSGGPAVPTRLVQACVAAAKKHQRRHEERRLARCRVHVEVLARNVLWQQDSAHLGRVGGAAVQAEVLRDAAVPGPLAVSVGGDVTAADAIATLESAIAAAGAAPLVVGTDNGPAYTSGEFSECLRRHRVVHLKNLPHTPQHNARAERTIRDVKETSGLGSGVVLASIDEAAVRIAVACARLELQAQLTAAAPPLTVRYTPEERDRFYEAVCRRIARAVLCARNARERRMAEREAIFAELEERGLIERTRGGARVPIPKAEIIS